jgi:hypothetical protein
MKVNFLMDNLKAKAKKLPHNIITSEILQKEKSIAKVK